MQNKQVTLDDMGLSKTFTVSALPAFKAYLLGLDLIKVMVDTDLIEKVYLQAIFARCLRSDQEVEGVSREQMEWYINNFDETKLVSNIMQSILNGITREKLTEITTECFGSVIYHNGVVTVEGITLINGGIDDFLIYIALVKEVLNLTYGGCIARAKKLLM